MTYPKQIIVVRKDLQMSSGKTAAQVAHASMGVFFDWMKENYNIVNVNNDITYTQYSLRLLNDGVVYNWFNGAFTKVVLGVDSLDELMAIDTLVKERGLLSCLITDNGLTEFSGPTVTCLAIGPLLDNEFADITSHLKLLKDSSKEELSSHKKLLSQLSSEVNRLKKKGIEVDSIQSIITKFATKHGLKL